MCVCVLLLCLVYAGVVLKDLKRLPEAEACFDAVVRLRPNCALAHGNLAGKHTHGVESPSLHVQGWGPLLCTSLLSARIVCFCSP